MVQIDRYGLPLSTDSDIAAELYRKGVDLLLATWQGAAETLDAAMAEDPEFALAHAARARLHFSSAELSQAKAAISSAVECASRNCTPREKSHIEILSRSINGQSPAALALTLEHLDRWPRDAIIMSLPMGAFGLFAFSGMADHDQARVDLCERHAHHYGTDWWFETYYGWSLTENGDTARGRALTEHAFEQRRDNANALHALAHAMFEEGAVNEADSLIEGWLPRYDRSALLFTHITWHQALGALERGDVSKALAIYHNSIRPGTTAAPPLNVITDGASLLWRTQLAGSTVPAELWQHLASYAVSKFPSAGVTFADVHIAFALAAAGDDPALDLRLAAMENRLASGALAAGPAVPEICRAMRAFAAEDYGRCAALLEPVSSEVVRIGGSHAQRELFEDTLIVALLKSGAIGKARASLDARLHRRPSSRDQRWRSELGTTQDSA